MALNSENAASVARAESAADPQEWVARLPIWRNKVVVRQLAAVFVIPLLFLALVLAIVLWPPVGEQFLTLLKIVGITGGVYLVLMLLGTALIGLGGYEMVYRLDERGIGGRPHGRTAKRNRIINTLLMLSGRPSAMGSGMLAQSRQAEYVAWRDVDRAEGDSKQRTVALYKGRRAVMVVACDEAHYATVLQRAQNATR